MRLRALLRAVDSTLVHLHNEARWPAALRAQLADQVTVQPDFISEQEETDLLKEIEPHMKRLKYEKDHWDNAIYLYREREHSRWSAAANRAVVERMRRASFAADAAHLTYTHILDLHARGHIRPHVDAVRYCGTTISGVSLLSACVMRLRHTHQPHLCMDLHLPRRSLYKMSDIGRYEFTHEVLSAEESEFHGKKVERGRRISVICRDLPKNEHEPDKDVQWTRLEMQ